MAHPHKAELNLFWQKCADLDLQIEVGETEKDCIDTNIWKKFEHPSTKKAPPPNDPPGYEPQTRHLVHRVLYRTKSISITTYWYMVLVEEITTFGPEVIPL